MLAPIATLVFLTALWFAAKVIFDLADSLGARSASALRGKPVPARAAFAVRKRPTRASFARPSPLRARPEWRAAA